LDRDPQWFVATAGFAFYAPVFSRRVSGQLLALLVGHRREIVPFSNKQKQGIIALPGRPLRRDDFGLPSSHNNTCRPLLCLCAMRALRRLQREQEPKSPFVFTSERGSPFTTAGFARLVERAGEAAGFDFPSVFSRLGPEDYPAGP
jgi:hypothetical protein